MLMPKLQVRTAITTQPVQGPFKQHTVLGEVLRASQAAACQSTTQQLLSALCAAVSATSTPQNTKHMTGLQAYMGTNQA